MIKSSAFFLEQRSEVTCAGPAASAGGAVIQQLLSWVVGLWGSASPSEPAGATGLLLEECRPPGSWNVAGKSRVRRGDSAAHLLFVLVNTGFRIKAQLLQAQRSKVKGKPNSELELLKLKPLAWSLSWAISGEVPLGHLMDWPTETWAHGRMLEKTVWGCLNPVLRYLKPEQKGEKVGGLWFGGRSTGREGRGQLWANRLPLSRVPSPHSAVYSPWKFFPVLSKHE